MSKVAEYLAASTRATNADVDASTEFLITDAIEHVPVTVRGLYTASCLARFVQGRRLMRSASEQTGNARWPSKPRVPA